MTPGAPPSASTHRPESSATAGRPVAAEAWRALASAFSTKLGCGSSASPTPNTACGMTSMPSGASRACISAAFLALLLARTSRVLMVGSPGYGRTSFSACAPRLLPRPHSGRRTAAGFRPDSGRERGRAHRGALQFEQLAAAEFGEGDERVELGARKRRAFGRALHLDQAAALGHHHVHVGVAVGVLGVVEVEHRLALVDAHRHRGDEFAHRVVGELAGGDQADQGVVHRDAGAGDGGGAGAAVGLQHVAVHDDLALAERAEVDHRAQAAPDQALDLLGAAALLALGSLACAAGVGGARQHAVFGGDPALALAAQEAGYVFFNAGGAQHAGGAEFDQHRAFGVAGEAAGEADGAELVGLALAGSHAGVSYGFWSNLRMVALISRMARSISSSLRSLAGP